MVSDPRQLGDPISRCRKMSIRGNSDTDRRRYRKCEEKGQPGTFTAGTAEDVRIEATRRSIAGKAGDTGRGATQDLYRGRSRRKREPPGKPGTPPKPEAPKASRFGATRAEIAGTAEGPRTRGNLRNRTPAQQKGNGVRGNPETKPRRSGKVQEAGQLAASSAGRTSRCIIR